MFPPAYNDNALNAVMKLVTYKSRKSELLIFMETRTRKSRNKRY